MARMHSRRNGKSGSTRPPQKTPPDWCNRTGEEVEEIIVKLGNEGHTPSSIGMVLRDTYGVPLVKNLMGKSISAILEENDIQVTKVPEDLYNLIKKSVKLRKHLEFNPKDLHSKRGLQLIESKLRRIAKYYVRTSKLPTDWKYDPMKAAQLIF